MRLLWVQLNPWFLLSHIKSRQAYDQLNPMMSGLQWRFLTCPSPISAFRRCLWMKNMWYCLRCTNGVARYNSTVMAKRIKTDTRKSSVDFCLAIQLSITYPEITFIVCCLWLNLQSVFKNNYTSKVFAMYFRQYRYSPTEFFEIRRMSIALLLS